MAHPTKGSQPTSASAGTARAQALVRIGTRKRVGVMAGATRREPKNMHLGTNLPAHNMGDEESEPAPLVGGYHPPNGRNAHLGTSLPAHVRAR